MAKATPMATPTIRSAAPKAKMTIYFALLIIALIAMLFACLFLYLEVRRFGGFGAVSGRASATDRSIRSASVLLARHWAVQPPSIDIAAPVT